MVNKKYKLYSSILALGLTLALMATGVWAILQQSLGVSTTVSFTATSVKGTINGEVEGGYAGVEADYEATALGGSPALTGAEIVQFGTKYVFANITGTNSSWNGKEAYCINGVTTEKVGEVVSSATLASAGTSYTVSNKSYVSNFSPTSPTTNWSIVDMAFQPNSEGQTSAITLTLTIKNTGSSVIAVSFPDDLRSAAMSETTAPNDNLLVSYAISNNGSAFSEPVAFSTINSKSIVSGGITTIKILVTVQDDSSSIPNALNIAFQLKLEKGVDVWSGETALAFAGGDGTEGSPYEISNGEQLAYLASGTNDGTLVTLGKYFKQTQPIVLNNYALIFDSASGLVLVNNNTETLYCLGTGLNGTIYHTSDAGQMGTVYAPSSATDNNLIEDSVPVDLKVWTPIGTSTYNFQGTFDGKGYEVSGIYINNTLANQGLFGYSYGATIQNVGVVDSYVSSISNNGYIGCVAGYGENLNIDYCYNFGNISGKCEVGGVVGYNNNGATTNCYNTGTVGGKDGSDIGGVIGWNKNNGPINNCYNTGIVSGEQGVDFSGCSYIGGVVGWNTGATNNCYNTGIVSGIKYIGGVVGQSNASMSYCYNTGIVSGIEDNIGGVVGKSDASMSYCYNTGTVSGGKYGNIGGVTGRNNGGYIGNCYNTGSVNGTMGDYAGNNGGVTGCNDGDIENCYNTGSVSGNESIGGIIGLLSGQGSITNCYNYGSVSGNDRIGGIIGFSNKGSITNCYNIGNISDTATKVGGIVGWNNIGNISNCYYLSSSATTTAIGVNEVGNSYTNIGSVTGPSAYIIYITDSDGFTTNPSTTTLLISALNSWVTANQTDPVTYRTWTLTGSTNGYPSFA